jgi:phospholipid/cholesterol/gamma-HCH transport system permease protein
LIGGWITSFYTLRLNTSLYWSTALRSIDYNNVLEGLAKPVVFGFIIGMIGCYFGLGTKGGTQGVGRNTTQAVVVASILVIVADFFLSKIILELRY